MTRRWTNTPEANEIPFNPPDNCCFDATDVQEAINQILHIGSLVAVQLDGAAVIGYCDLVKYSPTNIGVGFLYKEIR